MELRKTEREDIPAVMEIFRAAQAFLKMQGVDQWQDGYPNDAVVEEDIAREESYVLTEDGSVIATAMLSLRPEPMYDEITGSGWKCAGKSAVIHRIATDGSLRGKGVAVGLMGLLEAVCAENGMESVRVDTHQANKPMQALMKKLGYEECGVVLMPDGVSERVAFEKLLGEE